MMLADHILAARGTPADVLGCASSMGAVIEKAQRFDLHDDVVLACSDLLVSRPSTLVAALPLCRLPYPVMWMEFRGGLLGSKEHNRRNEAVAPVPRREGFLVEQIAPNCGVMTAAWTHHRNQLERDEDCGLEFVPNMSPIGVYFDFNEGRGVVPLIEAMHAQFANSAGPEMARVLTTWSDFYCREQTDAEARAFLSSMTGKRWDRLRDQPEEYEALRHINRVMAPGISAHGFRIANLITERATRAELRMLVTNWQADMAGSGAFLRCILAMMNTTNKVMTYAAADNESLNRVRGKRGKRPLLAFTVTRLTMSRARQNAAAARGMTREQARQHLVRGHFKIRKSSKGAGVFWWSPFLRGDPRRPVERRQYDVVQQ